MPTTISEEAMLHGRIELLRAQFPFVLLVNVLVSLVSAWFLREHVPPRTLVLWVAAIWALTLLRGLVDRWLDRQPQTPRTLRLRFVAYAVGSLVSGVVWGSSVWYLIDADDPVYTALVLLMLAGMTAGGVPSLSPHALVYFCYAVPALVPITWRFIAGDLAEVVPAAGVFMLLFLGANIGFSLRLHRKYGETIAYRYENAQLVERLREQMRIAHEANAAKSRFFAAASHDLRQPLYAMGLFLDALGQTLEAPRQRQLLGRAHQSLEALRQLFDALLDLSRLDAQAVDVSVTRVDLGALFDVLQGEFEPLAGEKGLVLRIRPGAPPVRTDALLLERMLRNLLSNALRYTERGWVELSWARRGSRLWLSVSDTGPGIAAADRERIFDEFQQAGGETRGRRHGLGLGLAIVRRLSRLLDHPLTLHSEPGRGSRFVLQLPVAEGPADEEAHEPDSVPAPWQGRVLVVDDDADVLDALVEVLQSWGMEVRAASDDGQALALVEAGFAPQLLITDYRLPRGPVGLELIDRMRDTVGPELGVLLITGDTAPAELSRIHAHGTRVLNKPVAAERLRHAIDREMDAAD